MGVLLDGYTVKKTLPARGRTPALTFEYRPAMSEAVYEYLTAPRANGKEAFKRVVNLLTPHLISWDVTESKNGEMSTVPITVDSLKKVPHRVLEQLVDAVTGYTDEEQAEDLKN